MPRPTTQNELLKLAQSEFSKLQELLNMMSKEELSANLSPNERDKNARDILAHLHEWHNLLLAWVRANTSGNPSPFLPAPYNWKTYPQMNIKLWEKHQNTPYVDAKTMLEKTHHEVMDLIKTFSNEELFSKEAFSWTGTTTLGSYIISATSSHYNWAIKDLKKALKKYRG